MSRTSDRNRTGIGAKRKRQELKKAYELGLKDASRTRIPKRELSFQAVEQALVKAGGWISHVEIDGNVPSNFYVWVKKYDLVRRARDLRRANPRPGLISEQDIKNALVQSGGVIGRVKIHGRKVDITHYIDKYELREFARELRKQNPTVRNGRPVQFTTDEVREQLVQCNGSYTEAERMGIAKMATMIQRARSHGLIGFARDLRKANPRRPTVPMGRPVYDDIAPETALDAFRDLRTVNKVASALSCTRDRVLRLLGEALEPELKERGIDLNTWLREKTRWNAPAAAKRDQIWEAALESIRQKQKYKKMT